MSVDADGKVTYSFTEESLEIPGVSVGDREELKEGAKYQVDEREEHTRMVIRPF